MPKNLQIKIFVTLDPTLSKRDNVAGVVAALLV